jgi:prolyl-tRNA synthetase
VRTSKLYAPTLRQTPAEAEVPSHQLMLRAGFIRKVAGGVYTYLPLAWRTLRKIEQIIREEMEAKDGQELALPIVQPAELWKETGRWEVFGEEMFRLVDRHNREFCLGPTHEEIITDLVRNEVRSYKQLPLLLYQIQNKYRDEIRPRFGLMRGREFIMKDAYSFDKDEAGLDKSYKDMYDAYTNIFNRCGLTFRPVEADGGAIGNATTHEFTVLAETGESDIVYCEKCDYAANAEKSELKPIVAPAEEELPLEKVNTPGTKTIEAVAEFLNTPIEKNIKAVIFQNEKDQVICAFVRGDHEVNDVKLQNITGAITLKMAEESAIRAIGGVPGFMSPIGLSEDAIVVVDATVMEMHNAVCGANEEDCHYKNANPKRDFGDVIVADIRLIAQGDPCPHCGAPVKMTHGIEVGQVFKLGIKYSKALGATFLDENGKEKPLIMGCYGIGVSRTMAAAIEQFHDDNGIIWPASIAPFEVVIVPINAKDEAQMQIAEKLYADMKNAGIDVLLDDRKDRAGVKFKDADLIGYPVRITVSPKLLDANEVEIKVRRDGATSNVKVDDCAQTVKDMLKNL